jgi:DNA mismatch repair protein MutS2
MDAKSINTLEFQKVLDRLSGYSSFSASAALVRALRPTNDFELAAERQARTSEARRLLSEHANLTIGGARDVRPQAELASRGGVLSPEEFQDIKATLTASRDLHRFFVKLDLPIPNLMKIALELEPPQGVIEAIGNVVSDRGEILDKASERLAELRREVKTANDRVMSKLGHFINDPSSARMLQEPIITIRNNRYVVPIKAEYKGRIRCVVQDQSASGATLFIEPLAVVDLNNRWTEAVMSEQEEVQRILAELSVLVGEATPAIQANVRALATLDFSLACARYADDLKASEPVLREVQADSDPEPIIKFIRARHPLLESEKVVPIDIALEKGTRALIITGPNTGGKTVSLKTAGLLTLMAQSGLHIPTQSGSETSVFKDVFADIGDEQSIEQSLSTFSAHVTNIVRILKRANRSTLIILDELGAGTDPQEGSALARAILTYLLNRQAPCLIATHYPELKVFAHSTEGAMNASVEFDLNSLRPTYRLITGLPGRSNALEIAKRLGLEEGIVDTARSMLNPEDLHAEDLLDEIHRQMEVARKERTDAENLRLEAENERQALSEKLAAIDEERIRVLEEAREQARQELEELKTSIAEMRRQTQAPLESTQQKKELRRQAAELEESLSVPLQPEIPEPIRKRPLRTGDRVYVRSLKTEGTVTAIEEDQIEVQIGKMRLKTDLRNIQRSKAGENLVIREVQTPTASHKVFHPSPGIELHLRGVRGEDALLKLEQYLDDAYAAGLPYVRIVHGKGTGTLRQLVRQALSESPLVSRWENALDNEGGDGVTIVRL